MMQYFVQQALPHKTIEGLIMKSRKVISSQIYASNLTFIIDVYSATYSGVAVYEMMCRTVAVMRRRADSFLNATQILKVAGIDKGRRTKILERVISNGEHEKVQGVIKIKQYLFLHFKYRRDTENTKVHGFRLKEVLNWPNSMVLKISLDQFLNLNLPLNIMEM